MSEKGTFLCYRERSFNKRQLAMLGRCNEIIEWYEGAGYAMSLRQLYYQLVAANVIANSESSYNSLGNLISEGRMAGLVSWTAIEDRGRYLQGAHTYGSPKDALKLLRKDYRRDLWEDQPCRVEVRCEKQALEGVVESICDTLRVKFTSLKGYSSQSETWRAGRRYAAMYQRGQQPVVLYLGDHDPSGIHMTVDQEERLSLFAGVSVHVVRVALNRDQIDEHELPPQPAKDTDSRYEGYRAEHGDESWELDALRPDTLHELIKAEVARYRDDDLWDRALDREAADLNDLDVMIEEA